MSEQLELFPDLVSGENELWDFARWVLAQAFDGMDLGGDEIQERALALGLIRKTAYDPERHGNRGHMFEPGDPWFEFAGPLEDRLT
jgi:hypothetical protein